MKFIQKPFVELLYSETKVNLHFDNKDRMSIMELFSGLKTDEEYTITVKKQSKRRSLDANAYMWVLAEEIAKIIGATRTEVYKKAIKEVGVFHDMAVLDKDVEDVCHIWELNGIGYFAEKFESKLIGCQKVRFYHGSHLYKSDEMARLIDYLIEEAKELGIETMTPNRLAELKAAWKG